MKKWMMSKIASLSKNEGIWLPMFVCEIIRYPGYNFIIVAITMYVIKDICLL